jgi:hypothetical protein
MEARSGSAQHIVSILAGSLLASLGIAILAPADGDARRRDRAAPKVTLAAPAPGSTLTTPQPTFSGTAGAATGDLAAVTVKVWAGGGTSGTLVDTLAAARGAGGGYSVVSSGDLAAGTYTARAQQQDTAGNTGLSQANTFSFQVSAPPPEDPPPPPPAEDPPPPMGDCGWGSFSELNPPGGCWRPYTAQSPFNRGVPAGPRLVSNSSAIVSRTLNFGNTTNGTYWTAGLADTKADYDHPIYYSRPTDPEYTIRCRQWVATCELEGAKVRIPAGARPAGGGDGHLTVIDQASGLEYDLWKAESLPSGGGTLYTGHGGITRVDGDGLGSAGTAAKFGLAAGVIRPEELAAGRIDHALFMTVKCTNGSYVWPAPSAGSRTCSSMGLSNADAPALGQHFFLSMSDAEIDALAVPAWKRTVLRAAARYGMFVGDTGADALGWMLLMQSSQSYTSFGHADPWVAQAKQYGISPWFRSDLNKNVYVFDLRNAISWGSKLRVADPCVSQGNC